MLIFCKLAFAHSGARCDTLGLCDAHIPQCWHLLHSGGNDGQLWNDKLTDIVRTFQTRKMHTKL